MKVTYVLLMAGTFLISTLELKAQIFNTEYENANSPQHIYEQSKCPAGTTVLIKALPQSPDFYEHLCLDLKGNVVRGFTVQNSKKTGRNTVLRIKEDVRFEGYLKKHRLESLPRLADPMQLNQTELAFFKEIAMTQPQDGFFDSQVGTPSYNLHYFADESKDATNRIATFDLVVSNNYVGATLAYSKDPIKSFYYQQTPQLNQISYTRITMQNKFNDPKKADLNTTDTRLVCRVDETYFHRSVELIFSSGSGGSNYTVLLNGEKKFDGKLTALSPQAQDVIDANPTQTDINAILSTCSKSNLKPDDTRLISKTFKKLDKPNTASVEEPKTPKRAKSAHKK